MFRKVEIKLADMGGADDDDTNSNWSTDCDDDLDQQENPRQELFNLKVEESMDPDTCSDR